MSDNQLFITEVRIKKLRHLLNIDIQMSDKERKHLLITGKNGSGKTSLLLAMKDYLLGIENNQVNNLPTMKSNIELWKKNILDTEKRLGQIPSDQKIPLLNNIKTFKNAINSQQPILDKYNETITISFSDSLTLYDDYINGSFIISIFDAKRATTLNIPKGITKINLKQRYQISEKAGVDFIQYIVNLKADRSFARDEKDDSSVLEIDNWFEIFENSLKEIFSDQTLKLEFDRKNYNFELLTAGHEKTDLNHLSDGYSAILNIITELILRMESKSSKTYNLQGIVLIDEIETHLHIELQKKILPFLIKFFPNIQFIVTTHSPFVISSIENAIVFDLEKKYKVEDMTGYSIDAIIESYFDSDKYSEELKKKVERLEYLILKSEKNQTEITEITDLKKYFSEIPKFNSPELVLKLQQLDLSNLSKNDKFN